MYGFPQVTDRQVLWSWITNIASNINRPWLIIGDLNQVADHKDKYSASTSIPGQVSFCSMIDVCNLIDVVPKSGWFTWSNNRQGSHLVLESLDRTSCNNLWWQAYPNSVLETLAIAASGHSPIFFQTEKFSQGFKPFRFENFWLPFPTCHDIVRKEWRLEVHGSFAFKNHVRLNQIRKKLIDWNNSSVGNIRQNISIVGF